MLKSLLVSKKPVIISGSPRSGSTWIGRVIEQHADTQYVHEPFNIGIDRANNPFKYWIEGVFSGQGKGHLNNVKTYLESFYKVTPGFLKQQYKELGGVKSLRDVLWRAKERKRLKTIIKDPIAFFAVEWLSENISDKVIVTIRHPAAVVASLKQKNWGYEFDQMLKQPELMENYLNPLRSEIELFASDNNKTLVEQGALLWRCVYLTNLKLMEKHENWLFVKNEDLSLDPMKEYEQIFKFIELPFSNEVQTYIERSTNAKSGEETDLVRDSRKNVDKWKQILSSEEIEFIKNYTQDVWKEYYTENDWR